MWTQMTSGVLEGPSSGKGVVDGSWVSCFQRPASLFFLKKNTLGMSPSTPGEAPLIYYGRGHPPPPPHMNSSFSGFCKSVEEKLLVKWIQFKNIIGYIWHQGEPKNRTKKILTIFKTSLQNETSLFIEPQPYIHLNYIWIFYLLPWILIFIFMGFFHFHSFDGF